MNLLYFYNNVKKKKKKVTGNLSTITFFVQTFLINFLLKKNLQLKKLHSSFHITSNFLFYILT